jgi:glycosyltransferase involved in cell wall biosynthesis
MNLLQICPNPFPALGGPAKTYRQFHDAVGAATIGFIAPTDGAGEKAVVPLAASVHTLGGKIGRYYYAPGSRLHEADAAIGSADLVFLHGLFTHPPVWAVAACKRHGVPYAVALHGILDPWALQKSRHVKQAWMSLFGHEILRNASAVVCATQREADKAAPLLKEAGPVRIISWACEIPGEDKVTGRRAELRRELGFGQGDRVIVFLGRLHSMKRPREIVRLLAGFGNENLKLLMIGPDEDVSRRQLEAEAQALHWNGLRVIGPVFGDEKFRYLGAADAFISLSHRENFNYALAEAMAAGLPPILSPGNDLGWEFADGGFSWQLKTDDPAEARGVLDEFLLMPEDELKRRGAAAREWTRRHLSLDRLRDQLNSLNPCARRAAV